MVLRRRTLLRNTGIVAAAQFAAPFLRAVPDAPARPPRFTSVEAIYRQRWRWDRIVKVSHTRANCISACSWDAYVRGGIVWREEQNRIYEASGPGIPDFNPRGCQKGACWSDQMTSPTRILHPMRRVGPRGSGRWERISWDEAYDQIADAIVAACLEGEVHRIVYDHGTTNLDFGPDQMWEMRLFSLLGATELDSWGLVGDEMMGAIQTMGMQNIEGTSDDWFRSDYLVIWMGNPVYSRIPEAHFLTEARYNGARLVVVAPDYSATAIKADLWLPVRPRADAALALAACQVIVAEGLYDEAYLIRYTDLPLLVRTDTGRFLRASDLGHVRAGEHRYFVWDRRRGRAVEVPGSWDHPERTLRLPEGIEPALDGSFTVTTAGGGRIAVRTVWSYLVERLASFTPEATAPETGIHPEVVRTFAREFARAKAPLIYSSWGSGKGYHTDLEQRAKILMCALAGAHGRPGAGFRIAAWFTPEAWIGVSYGQSEVFPDELGFFRHLVRLAERLGLDDDPTTLRRALDLMDDDPATLEALYQHAKVGVVPAIPWFYLIEPAWREAMAADHAPSYPRPLADYMREALRQAYARNPYMQKAEVPRLYLYTGVNPLRRLWLYDKIRESSWSRIDLIVGVGIQMNYTMHYSDIVLPAAGWYEKLGLKYTSSYVPYLIVSDQAVPPLGESKDEFTIFGELAQRISEKAKGLPRSTYRDPYGRERDLAELYHRWSFAGDIPPTPEGKERAFELVLKASSIANPLFSDTLQRKGLGPALSTLTEPEVDLARLRREGAVRIRSTGKYTPINGVGDELRPGEPITPHRWFIEREVPFPTATGRIQFLIDHPWYLEADEALPIYKPAPAVGGDHPFVLSGGHTRWSIHSQWRENALMLRLCRGEPVIHLSPADARRLGITDHELVEVYNDHGSIRCRVKVAPAVQPGVLLIYHAWQPFQFPGAASEKVLLGSPIKPLHLAGGYPQLDYRVAGAQPGHCPRDTRVSIRKLA